MCKKLIYLVSVVLVLALMSGSPCAAATLLHYDFGDGSGTTVTDLSGNGNHGTLVGFTDTAAGTGAFDSSEGWVTGGGLCFIDDSVRSYVETPLNLNALPGDFTLEFMANYAGSSGWTPAIGSNASGCCAEAIFFGINSNLTNAEVRLQNSGGAVGLHPWSSQPDMTVYHLALVYDAATNGVEVFADGTSIGTATRPANMAGATTQFLIANTGWSSGEQWDGILFGVAISDVKLNPDSFALLTAAEADTLSGLSDITVVDDAIVSLRHDDTEYVVANGDLMLGATTRWYIVDGVETLWVEGDPAPADTVSGTSNAKEGDVGSNADNFLFSLDGATEMSSIDGIDFQETIFPILTDTFFVFERNGNDAGTYQAILADGSLGAPIPIVAAGAGGPYADTGVNVNGQNAFGVVFKTVEPAQGVRITASGHDTISISIPTPLPLEVPMASAAPVIDGEMDATWDDVEATECLIIDIVNADSATPEGPNDLSCTFKAMYDADNIYVFAAVEDSFINGTISDYTDDGVEIFFDGDNSKGATYDGVNDTQIRITVDDVNLPDMDSSISKEGTVFKVMPTDSGYNIEASFPLDVLQITPGNVFGFEMQVNDNDGNGRETIMRWFSNNNDSWRDASLFGQAVLVDPLKKNLVALWDLDEGSGTTAADGSGNGHDGAVEGAPTWISPGWDGIGSCMQFGGDDDRITLESFDVTGTGVTLAAWINVIAFRDDARMVSKSQGSGTADHYWAMILSGSGEDNLECRLKTDTGSTARRTAPEGTDVPANEWTHVAVTWDAADPFMRLYKNGMEIDSVSKDGIAVATAADVKIGIGNQSATVPGDGGIRPFGGLLDDVRVYDRGLSEAEIAALMTPQ